MQMEDGNTTELSREFQISITRKKKDFDKSYGACSIELDISL